MRLTTNIVGVCWFAVLCVLAATAAGQHHTARFANSTGYILQVERILFAPNSFYLAAAVDDGSLCLFHVDTGRELKKLALRPLAMAFNPKGYQLFAVGSERSALIPVDDRPAIDARWQLPYGYLGITFTQNAGKILVERMAPGGPAAASGQLHVGDEVVAVVVSGKDLSVIGRTISEVLQRLAGMAGTMATMRVVPQGGVEPTTIALRRANGVKQNGEIKFLPPRAYASPQSLVVRWEDALVVLDAQDGMPISSVQPVDIEPFGLQTFSPDGTLLAVTAHRLHQVRGEPELAVEIHDVARQQRIAFATIDATNILDQRFSPDGRRLLWGLKDRILVYDLAKRAMAAPVLIGFDPARYQPQPRRKASESGSPLTDVTDRLRGYSDESAAAPNEYPEQLLASFDVSPDGKLVAVGSCHGEVRLFSTSEHKELAKVGERTNEEVRVRPVAFSPDGKWLAYYLQGTLHWQTLAGVLRDHASP